MQYSLGNMLNGGGGLNPDGLSLDLQFALDKTTTARKGPSPVFTRGSTGTFVGSNGLIQSAAVDIPRFDHDPVTFACKGLLIEESRTNLITNSQNFAANAWLADGTTKTSGLSGGLDGSSTVGQFSQPAGFNVNYTRNTGFNFVSGTTYTVSAWVALNSGAATVKFSYFNGAWNSSSALPLTSTLTRYTWTVTASGTPSLGVGLEISSTLGYQVRVWGFQIEAGSFPTSYIPTTTGSVVRSADVCSITGGNFTGIYNAIEGTFLSNSSQPFITPVNAEIYAADNGSDTERFNLRHQTSLAVSQVGGVTQSVIDLSDPTANAVSKIAYAYANANYGAARNGTLGLSSLNLAVPTVNRIFIGSKGHNSSEYLNGHIASIRYYRKRLPDAKLQDLTS
jgi:hypothetical protein